MEPENWLLDNDWFQLNTFAYGSNDLTQNQINQFAYQTRTFEIGDPIEETASFYLYIGFFNKVLKETLEIMVVHIIHMSTGT